MISEIKITGVDNVLKSIDNLRKELSDPRQPLNYSSNYMKAEAIRNFPSKGSIMQRGGWPPLAKPGWRTSATGRRYWFPGTEAIKAKAGFAGKPMMVRTGRLKASFTRSEPKISPARSSIEVFNPVPYAIEHQRGYGKLPRRVLLKIMARHVKEIRDIFVNWVVKSIKKSVK